MKTSKLLMCSAFFVFALIGCSKEEGESNSGAAGREAKQPTGPASAEAVAEEARGKVDCPPKAITTRPAGAPVDDVVGVRPGMIWAEATNFVMCDNPLLVVAETTSRNFSINTYGAKVRQGFEAKFAEAREVKTGKEIAQEMQAEMMRSGSNAYTPPLEPGQIRYFVSTMGVPGQERVLSVSRQEYYPSGQLPGVENTERALIGKYGLPSKTADHAASGSIDGGSRNLYWQYDTLGRKLTETSPLMMQCHADPSPDAATRLSPDCGVIVSATIMRSTSNPGLAHGIAVASLNGAEGYARLEKVEQALMQADEARKAKEVQSASQGAAQPKL